MSEQELGGIVLLGGYGLMLIGAIKIFGIRRVVMAILGIVLLGIVIAVRSLGVITGRRY